MPALICLIVGTAGLFLSSWLTSIRLYKIGYAVGYPSTIFIVVGGFMLAWHAWKQLR